MGKIGRYTRHMLLPEIGKNGQNRLLKSSAVVIGCGALGSITLNMLVRAGVGRVRAVDRDVVELNNLHRQTLFDEKDIGKPKAIVAAEKLRKVNSEIRIDSVVKDVDHSNIENLIKDMDIVLDGTDNMETRFLINDACVKHGISWIYCGAVGTYGMTMNIIPNKTPCFRCVFPTLKAGVLPTCDTVGVLNTVPAIMGAIESTEALKVLLEKNVSTKLLICDVYKQNFSFVKVRKKKNCECCAKQNFEFLNPEKIVPL